MSVKFIQSFFFISLSIFYGCQSVSTNVAGADDRNAQGIHIPKGSGPSFFQWSKDRVPLISAHRGGPYPGYPENAIETFEHIASQIPTIIECDIAMTRDSVLVMMHDNTLERTTTGEGKVNEVTFEYIKTLKLVDNEGSQTDYTVPTLIQVLEWANDKAVLTLDVKRGVPFEKVVETIKEYDAEDYAAVITYNAQDAAMVHELNDCLMISVSLGSMESYQSHRNFGVPNERMIAFVGVSKPKPNWYQILHEEGIYCILGVLGNLDRQAMAKGDSLYLKQIQAGADILATDRPLEAYEAIKSALPKISVKEDFIYGY